MAVMALTGAWAGACARIWSLLLVLLMISVPARADVEHVGPPEDIAAIEAHAAAWARLYAAGDMAAMAALYEPDAWLMTQGVPALRGRDAILDHLGRSAGGPAPDIRFANEQIRIEGDRAYLISKFWLEMPRADAPPVQLAGRSFLVFRKGPDGAWRLWRDMDNAAPDVRWEDRPEAAP